jgi:hypothetical protein
MIKNFITGILALSMTLVLGCNKEKTVTSTEYVHDIEYVKTPPDTVFQVDTVVTRDSVLVYAVDTVVLFDTTIQTVVDTVIQVQYVIDTVVTVEQHYDTVVIIDTVLTTQCSPNEHFAFAAIQYYTDPLVIELVYQEYGLTDGWIFYLSEFQSDWTVQPSNVYDVYGLIDYWTTDWSGFYPLEYYWRVSFLGGDPADVANWELSEPPSSASVGTQPGLRVLKDAQVRTVRH